MAVFRGQAGSRRAAMAGGSCRCSDTGLQRLRKGAAASKHRT